MVTYLLLLHKYLLVFYFPDKNWSLLRAECRTEGHFILLPLINPAKIFHIPINCKSKPKQGSLSETKHSIFIRLPNTCQIYEFLNHFPWFTIIYKGKNMRCFPEYLWKYIVAWGRVFFICWHLFLLLPFCIYNLSPLIFIVSLIFSFSRSFVFY